MVKKFDIKNAFSSTKLLLIIIVLFGLSLRLIFFSGMGISDSLVYSKTANDINIGEGIDPDSTLTLSTRLGLVYATAFSYKLFGINDFSSILFVLLASIGSIILIFYFGKLLFDEKTGLIAAFLLSFFPLDVVYSTQLLSDLPSAFFMSLGVYIFLYSEIKKIRNFYFYLLSGISIGIGYMIRESALLIALFFVFYILYKRNIKKDYFLVPLGVLIVIFIESLLFFSLTGDPFYRFDASQDYLERASIEHNYFGRLDFPQGLFHYPYVILTSSLLNLFYILIFAAILYFLVRKERKSHILMLWFIPLLLYLSLGSASLAKYIPFRAVDRYLFIIGIPGILLLALFFAERNSLIRKFVMPAALSILLLTSVFFVSLRDDRNLLDGLGELGPFLHNLDKTIYADSRSVMILNYLSGFDAKLDIKEYPESLKNVKDSYIVVNKEMIRNLREANPNRLFPAEIDVIPESWRLMKEVVEKDGKIIVYYSS